MPEDSTTAPGPERKIEPNPGGETEPLTAPTVQDATAPLTEPTDSTLIDSGDSGTTRVLPERPADTLIDKTAATVRESEPTRTEPLPANAPTEPAVPAQPVPQPPNGQQAPDGQATVPAPAPTVPSNPAPFEAAAQGAPTEPTVPAPDPRPSAQDSPTEPTVAAPDPGPTQPQPQPAPAPQPSTGLPAVAPPPPQVQRAVPPPGQNWGRPPAPAGSQNPPTAPIPANTEWQQPAPNYLPPPQWAQPPAPAQQQPPAQQPQWGQPPAPAQQQPPVQQPQMGPMGAYGGPVAPAQQPPVPGYGAPVVEQQQLPAQQPPPGAMAPYGAAAPAPGVPVQYDQYGRPVGYPGPGYPIPGQSPAIDAVPGQPRRKVPKWVMFGVPALVVAIVAGVLVAVNLGNSLDPTVTKVSCSNTADLASCIVQPPSGSSKASSTWASTTTVDAGAYSAAYADSAASQQPSSITALITNDGLKGIAHRAWTQGSNQVDLVLLQFGSPQGAQAWADDRTAEFLALGNGPQLTVPQIPLVKAYSSSAPDSAGYVDARLITTVGDIDLEVHYGSQSTMQQQDLNIWAGTEYQSLSTAPTVSPSPSPTATTFETATCPGNLNDCMMPYPAGGQQLTGIPTNYTVESFTKDFIKQEDVQSATQRMKDDNVFNIDSEAWYVSNGYGQVVLAQTRTEKQAQDLFGYIDRGDNTYPNTFPIPGYAGAVGRYFATADNQGFYDGLVTDQTGNVYVAMVLGFTGSFDVATSQGWAVQELNLLTQKTQSNWAVPIPQVSTPSLPAFTPGTCPSSGLTGCMMPTPSGATPGTAVRDIGVTDYVNSVFSDRQSYEQTWLTSDGAKDAATESWTGSSGAVATDYVLSFASSRQAKAAALQEAGDSMAGSQSCSLLSLPNMYCMVLPENVSNGQVPIRIVAWSGKYELDLEFTQNAAGSISTSAADTSDALNWAQAQLQLLAGG